MAILDNLVSYWKLDEASGNALDAHGSNELTDNNTVGSTTGKIGNARDFEAGNHEYFNRATNSDLETGDIDFSLSFWMKLESSADFEFLYKSNKSDNGYLFDYSSFNQTVRFWALSASSYGLTTWSATLSTGVWYHVVGWHDSVNNQVGIAVNDGTAVVESYSDGVATESEDFRLGGSGSGASFDGLIDELGFWKRVLASGERTQLYNGGAGLAYPFTVGPAIPVLMRQYRQRWAA